jgi:hypothetical protein
VGIAFVNAYVWLLLLACVGSALTAGMLLARDAASRSNRSAAFLSLCNAWWAMCEVAWNTSSDPETVMTLVRLSALGWIWIGPTALRVFLAATEDRSELGRRVIRAGYAATGVLLVLEWTTTWLHSGVVRTSWGWAYEFGPLYLPFYVITIASVGFGLWKGIDYVVRTASPAERRQGRWALVAISIPLVLASFTDGILPFVGVQLPRLGTICVPVCHDRLERASLRLLAAGSRALRPGDPRRALGWRRAAAGAGRDPRGEPRDGRAGGSRSRGAGG